jgi:DNA-binding MarR family transcriptional regulator
MATGTRSSRSTEVRLAAALATMHHHMPELLHETLRRYDLTPPQFITMRMLEDEPRSMRWLAERQNCDASNITGIADRLGERDLLARTADPADRRIKLLALTRAGGELMAQISDDLAAGFVSRLRLADDEKAQLADLLERGFATD